MIRKGRGSMPDVRVVRRGSLDGVPPVAVPGLLTVTALAPQARLVFRGNAAAAARAGDVFGVPLPTDMCRAHATANRAALHLGPDEWLLLAPEAELTAVMGAIGQALESDPHSLVDASHRDAGLLVAGVAAASTLNVGCPLDLDIEAFPVGMCTRTLLGKAEIVLWRTGAESFRVETARSFAHYVQAFLEEASRELGV